MTQAPALPASRALRTVCAGAIGIAAVGTAVLVARLVARVDADSLAPALLGLALGALAADGFSGLVHWACDTWGSVRTPLFGPTLIHSFREHHVDPDAMLRHDWVEVNREPGVAAALAVGVMLCGPGAALLARHPLLHAMLCSFVVFGAAANQLHYWAHAARAPRWVRWLQARRLVVSPEAHARHHRAPNTDAYCISGGWLNPPFDALGVWRALERAVERTTGTRPRSGSAAPPPASPPSLASPTSHASPPSPASPASPAAVR